ncbi:hypothetical protein IPG41_00360 [Candidatus Peregrinibacteria bacterium]|nr:MAG: hypothetical protein IPG41_00360 [Candidatus Peregrinibacteria bacterium]
MTNKELVKIILISAAVFLVLGAVTAVYENPFFQRMTPLYWFDYVFLGLESMLMGLFWGINAPACALKKAGFGGVFGFLGFACPVCNKLLLLLFGSGLLLTYFEPIRPFVGALGIVLISFAVYKKLSLKSLTLQSL